MARKKFSLDDSFVLFDVVYEDGTRSSRRRIAAADLSALDRDTDAKTMITAQDRKIAEMSGHDRGPIRSITRSPA
ncbi:MAG: hypothetical protein ACT4SY_14255 [Hyphomicrobiales bacterium]